MTEPLRVALAGLGTVGAGVIRLIDPPIDGRLPPPGTVDADTHLLREGAFGDFAVEGGPGQSGAIENGR